jgi:hypothetical protein
MTEDPDALVEVFMRCLRSLDAPAEVWTDSELLQRAWHYIGAELNTLGLLKWTCQGDEEVPELTVSARVAFQAWQQSRMQRHTPLLLH